MNKLRVFFILLFICFIANVNAITLKPNCSGSYKVGDTFDVYINVSRGGTEATVSAVDGTFNYDESILSLQSQSIVISDWISLSTVKNNGVFNFSNIMFNNVISGSSANIAKVTFKVNKEFSSTTLSINSVNGVDGDSNAITNISGGTCSISYQTPSIETNVQVPVDNRSNVNTLKSLTLSAGSIEFKSTKNNYDITVDNTVDSIEISSELSDLKASYVNGYGDRKVNLKVGDNTVLIKIKAENENVRTYKLNIKRLEDMSSVILVKNITIDGYDFDFDSNITEYSLKIKDEKKLAINVETFVDSNFIIINGNENLQNGSVIKINVSNNGGKDEVYMINIIKEQDVDEKVDNSDIVFEDTVKKGKISVGFFISIFLNILLIALIVGYVVYHKIRYKKR